MPYTLSPSSLNLLKECPRCFWLHFNRNIKRPNGAFPSLPSGMDRILKLHFDTFCEKKMLPPEICELENVKLFGNTGLLEVWRNNRKGIEWTDEEGNVFKGAVDNILEKNGKLIVLDYKTRGFPLHDDTAEHYQDQLDIYNLLLRKNGFETEDYAYLLFYHPEKVDEDGDVIFNTDLVRMNVSIENAKEIFKKAIEVLKGEMPEWKETCGFCKWIMNNRV